MQRAPELFPTVKRVVDRPDEKGRIVLAGPQTYHFMKGVSESLAGRIRIIEMPPLSLRELVPSCGGRNPYIPSPVKPTEPAFTDIWGIVHRGSMPELQNEAIEWDSFCTDYASSYLIARNVQAVPVWAI